MKLWIWLLPTSGKKGDPDLTTSKYPGNAVSFYIRDPCQIEYKQENQ